METQKPVHEVRLGKIKAAIWANESERGIRYNVTVSRIYKDGDEWKSSESFGRDDIPLVIKALDRAHDFMFAAGKNEA